MSTLPAFPFAITGKHFIGVAPKDLTKVGLDPAWQEFIDLRCTTFPEAPYDPRSDCHGWSALPLYVFADRTRRSTP